MEQDAYLEKLEEFSRAMIEARKTEECNAKVPDCLKNG